MTPASTRSPYDWRLFRISAIVFMLLCLAGALNGAPGQSTLDLGFMLLPSGRFILIHALVWFSGLGLFLLLPQGVQAGTAWKVILVLALIARLFWLGLPASDDVNRYMWEGHLLIQGISPYHHAPLAPELSDLARNFPYFDGINHPDIPAAYPPMLLSFFSLLDLTAMHPLTVKTAMAGLDLLAVCLIMLYLRDRNRDLRWALLYAVNPLVLVSFAGEGHGDVLQTVFVMGALCLFERKRFAWMYIFLGLAVQSKYVAVFMVPFFITRENLKFIPLFLAMAILPCVPFASKGWTGLSSGLLTFGTDFAFNGPAQSLLEALGMGRHAARIVCGGLFILTFTSALVLFRCGGMKNKENTPVSGSLAVLGGLLLLSPTVHAWYVCWLLPLAAIRARSSWLLLSLFMGFYYVAPGMENLGRSWDLPPWALFIQWAPFGLVFMVEGLIFLVRFPVTPYQNEARSVSVVIPAKNEEQSIGDCITPILDDPVVCEVIVVDGGSTDKTHEAAKRAGAVVVIHDHPPEQGGGRGGQIHRGLRETKGDVVALVHADTRLAPGSLTGLLAFLSKNPGVSGGALGTVFDQFSIRMKVIECLNILRAAFFSVSFGDQIQFFRRKPVVDRDLFPPLPLMEDVEFSLRLQKLGRTAYLFGASGVSSRRWQKEGMKNIATVLTCFFAYLAIRIVKMPDTVSMYRRYYKK